MREASVKRTLNSPSKRWVVDEDMDQWKANVIQVSDGEEPDEDSLRKKLCLDVDDSPWTLDDKLSCVVLKKIPKMVRIPIALFKGLFPHQRQGIEWMADLHIEETGGILGDVSRLLFIVLIAHHFTRCVCLSSKLTSTLTSVRRW